jgi:glycosyltransferase involved in cell wall biosynthesis
MATYNGEKYIEQQLLSILSQLASDDEVIISDDHSKDATLGIVANLADARVKVVRPSTPQGPIHNFEHALGYATKDVVVLSDQDDVWLEHRAAEIRNYFRNSIAKYDLLVLDSFVVDQHLKVVEPSVFALLEAGSGLFKNIYRNTYIGCHMAFRRKLLDVALPFPAHISMHDVWLGLVSELMGPVKFLPGPSMLFRRTGNNFTKPKYPWRVRILWRFYLLAYIARLVVTRPDIIPNLFLKGWS